MTRDIRRLTEPGELIDAARVFRIAMTGLPPLPPLDDGVLRALFEPGRAFGAFQDGRLVGTTNSYSGLIKAAGKNWLPQAAVTQVGVLPTHTRQGFARALIETQLRAVREAGEPIATLRASEASIYGNFGYAIASLSVGYEIDRSRAILRPEFRRPRQTRFVEGDHAWSLQERIYNNQPDPRTGTVSRPRHWWDANASRQARTGLPCYVVSQGAVGQETGYVRYRPLETDSWVASTNRTLVVDDLVARDAQSYIALISHLLSIDIAHRILLPVRPVDDLLPWLFLDWRCARSTKTVDETWLRLVDAQAALNGRSYDGSDAVVVEVVDEILAGNTVRLRITKDGAERSAAPAQVVTNVASMSAAYLGGMKWWQLAGLGKLEVADKAAVSALDRLFFAPQQPFAGTMF